MAERGMPFFCLPSDDPSRWTYDCSSMPRCSSNPWNIARKFIRIEAQTCALTDLFVFEEICVAAALFSETTAADSFIARVKVTPFFQQQHHMAFFWKPESTKHSHLICAGCDPIRSSQTVFKAVLRSVTAYKMFKHSNKTGIIWQTAVMPSSNPFKCPMITPKEETSDFAVTFDHLLQIMIPNRAPDFLLPFQAHTGFYSFVK